ncbi:hypothetical protein HU200_043261 [Digitaria exilis]|uniref:Uncharacterized protein n=1 Tax=Digitaria exilis TaxID=1010633 RepID=A0A835B4L5_9POAL|nr:hypothetical protein HU200_043261 [Digitaria exilis]
MVEHRPVMGNLSVLLLDDNPSSLWMIANVLVETGFKVFPFETVEMALDFVKRRPAIKEELDLVLAEVRLRNIAPGSSAHSELLHHILNELQVPLFTMCAHGDKDALSKHVALGACFHVLKPLHTGSLNMLKQKALEHKSKKAKPQGPIPSKTKSGMASSSTKRLQEMLIIERHNLSNPGSNESEVPEVDKQHGCSKKPGRFKWTVEFHEMFLDALGVLGDEYATPEGILKLMNVKGLTSKQIASHLQESITPRVDADIREVYPTRLWKQVKEAAAPKIGTYSFTSGTYIDGTKSVWDDYENKLQKQFAASNRSWQQKGLSSSKRQLPVKNNVVVISVESSGSSSLSTSLVDQDGENTRTEAAGNNDNVGNINMFKDGGISNESPKAACEIGYGASVESFGLSSLPTSLVAQIGENNRTEAAGNNDNVGNVNMLEGTMNKEHTVARDPDDVWGFLESNELDLTLPNDAKEEAISNLMNELQGLQDKQNLGLEDLLQVDNAWNTVMSILLLSDELIFAKRRSNPLLQDSISINHLPVV